ISNCLNAEIKKVFVLTQFNSASLNRHIVQTYKFDIFSDGFVDILAAEQTPDSADWFQGTADAVRQNIKHFGPYGEIEYIIILSGDQLYQMDFRELKRFHVEHGAEITVAAIPVSADQAPNFGIMKVDGTRVTSFREKPRSEELPALRYPLPHVSPAA